MCLHLVVVVVVVVVGTASEPVLEVSRGVLSRLGSVSTPFWRRLETS